MAWDEYKNPRFYSKYKHHRLIYIMKSTQVILAFQKNNSYFSKKTNNKDYLAWDEHNVHDDVKKYRHPMYIMISPFNQGTQLI
jgi:hypothetical protein